MVVHNGFSRAMMMAPIISKAVVVDAIVVQKLDIHTATEKTRDFLRNDDCRDSNIFQRCPCFERFVVQVLHAKPFAATITIVVTLIIFEAALASQVFSCFPSQDTN